MKVVVVESPAKAKTINKYLGKDYEVLASFGHIRDLPPKDGSVDPEQDFRMIWELESRGADFIFRCGRFSGFSQDFDAAAHRTGRDRQRDCLSYLSPGC